MSDPRSLVRAPKQNRSRASFDRVLDAATELLAERGTDDFTLTELSRRAEASIGSIYGRVSGKDDLIRIVQARVLERLEAENDERFDLKRWEGESLQDLIPGLIREVNDVLREYAPIMRTLMRRAVTDPVVARVGGASYSRFESQFKLLLLARRSEILHPDPERAVNSCFSIIWSTMARFLGLGMVGPSKIQGDWDQVSEDLGAMCSLFLLSEHTGS